jgi:hypothetical protein
VSAAEVLPHIAVPALEEGVAEALQARDIDSLAQLLGHLEERAPERFALIVMAMEVGLAGFVRDEALYTAALTHTTEGTPT